MGLTVLEIGEEGKALALSLDPLRRELKPLPMILAALTQMYQVRLQKISIFGK